MSNRYGINHVFSLIDFQVKIWFQNRRSKYKKMMKAAQGPPGSGGGMQLGAPNQGLYNSKLVFDGG